jgi:hypothetical protein
MMNHTQSFDTISRLFDLADTLSSAIDPDFDAEQEDLEREFAELRLQLNTVE